jgi:gliding-associated putative ABC transporter substrate-binding component GldG
MVNWGSKKTGDILMLANGLALVVFINVVASTHFFRIDLTEEKRFSMKPETRELLETLEEKVYIEVFLEGDLNPSFSRFQKSIRETLEEFRIYSDNKVQFTFSDPGIAKGEKAKNEFMQYLSSKGIAPRNVIDTRDGQRVEKIVFPGAMISYDGLETGVNFLKGNAAAGSENVINQSIEGVEYEIANAIYKLSNLNRKTVGLLTGHGELDSLEILSFKNTLREKYTVRTTPLTSPPDPAKIHALVIAKPRTRFSEQEKFRLDQYIMSGGRVMLLLDKLDATMDSASQENYFAFPLALNLDDQLFKYGLRINLDLVQDRSSALHPVVAGSVGGKPQLQLVEWPFYPLVNRYATHAITRNIDAVVTKFVSSIDTVKADGVNKMPLLFSSQYARTITAPVRVSVNDARLPVAAEVYNKPFIPVGYLLEGTFTSLYKNRFVPENIVATDVLQGSQFNKMVVIADGDLARNEINPRTGQALPLGSDKFSSYTFANAELLMNAMAWLLDEDALLAARTKEVKIRPLDKERVKQERLQWQLINIGLPLVLILLGGLAWAYGRKKRFAMKSP